MTGTAKAASRKRLPSAFVELTSLAHSGLPEYTPAWDLGKRFRRVAEAAGIKQLRIHDLRHFTASTLTSAGVADNIISLLTGHKSRELRRQPRRMAATMTSTGFVWSRAHGSRCS